MPERRVSPLYAFFSQGSCINSAALWKSCGELGQLLRIRHGDIPTTLRNARNASVCNQQLCRHPSEQPIHPTEESKPVVIPTSRGPNPASSLIHNAKTKNKQ